MSTQIADKLFSESFMMMNFDITFRKVHSWLELAGIDLDDSALFQALLMPEYLDIELQTELLQLIVYRFEDVFYQSNRNNYISYSENLEMLINDPIHQILLQMMRVRTLRGEQEALLDLYVLLQQDKLKTSPTYPTLHTLFDQKWIG